ncbi:unnamed protein product [Phytophthora fragariaefolia]|uniref:Unnamed protein product n=1 Tax=Phytophthora fragariaefolia TaxID=1490495 RepID=A0A9W6X4I2_9STRA|nr:unnamed protein product [Phytophthora fragariaefolia]
MDYAFDFILGMPWRTRYQPEIDWLARSVRRRADYDVREVFTHLLDAPSPHVAVVYRSSTTQLSQRVCDGPRCLTCAASIVEPTSGPSSRVREDTRNYAVEQRLLCENIAVELRLPHENIAVEQQLQHENIAVELRFPLVNASIEQRIPFADVPVAQTPTLRDAGVVERELPWIEGGEVPSSEPSRSETSASSSGSRRRRMSPRNRSGHRRLRRRVPAFEPVQHREVLNVVEYEEGSPNRARTIEVANPPSDAATFTWLPGLSWKHFLRELKASEIEQICLLTSSDQPAVLANTVSDDISSSRPKAAELKSVREKRFAAQSWSASKTRTTLSIHSRARSRTYSPRRSQHNFPLNGVFDKRSTSCPARNPHEREQHPPHGGQLSQRHALRVARNATGSEECSGDFQWHGLPRVRPLCAFAPVISAISLYTVALRMASALYTSGICVRRSRRCAKTSSPPTSRNVCSVRRKFRCWVTTSARMASAPEKISAIRSWPTPKNQTELRQWLGLAKYLHKYTKYYAGLIQPMASLLKKDVAWDWRPEHQDAFEAVKKSLASAPVFMLADTPRPFHVVCDASDFAIGCALMQFDVEVRERIVSYQSRQMKPAERNYPVHDKELLALRYALIKFRVYLLGGQTFAVYTNHASLRTAMKSPHLAQPPDNEDDDEDCAVCMVLGIYATVSSPVLPLRQQMADAYDDDAFYAGIIRYLRNPTCRCAREVEAPSA